MTFLIFFFFAIFFVAYKSLPLLDYDIFTPSGERGWIGSWHCHPPNNDDLSSHDDEVLKTQLVDEAWMFIGPSIPPGITMHWTLKLRGNLKPRPYDCLFEFGLTVAGRAKVCILIICLYIGLLTIYLLLTPSHHFWCLALRGWSVGDR